MNKQIQHRMSQNNTPSLPDFATTVRSKSGGNFCSECHTTNDSPSERNLMKFLKDLGECVKAKNSSIICLFTLNSLLRDVQLFLYKNEGIKVIMKLSLEIVRIPLTEENHSDSTMNKILELNKSLTTEISTSNHMFISEINLFSSAK